MKKRDFDEFYTKIVKPIAESFVNKYSEFCFKDEPAILYEEYINQKIFIRSMYHKMDGDANEKKDNLDRHKVCACMTSSIINSRLIYYSNIESNEELSRTNISRINEQLAFLSCWELLKAFVEARNKPYFDALADEHSNNFELPNTFHNDSFVDTVVRSLYYARTLNGISIPLLSNIYYLLEKYCEKGIDYKFN
ncbi:MAG: hypothetical protein IJN62_03105 [Clostridia bacterium]|nr:hypothetical protein [Clostridia bacterium]